MKNLGSPMRAHWQLHVVWETAIAIEVMLSRRQYAGSKYDCLFMDGSSRKVLLQYFPQSNKFGPADFDHHTDMRRWRKYFELLTPRAGHHPKKMLSSIVDLVRCTTQTKKAEATALIFEMGTPATPTRHRIPARHQRKTKLTRTLYEQPKEPVPQQKLCCSAQLSHARLQPVSQSRQCTEDGGRAPAVQGSPLRRSASHATTMTISKLDRHRQCRRALRHIRQLHDLEQL